MKQIGVIVLSYEEAGDLRSLIPWKTDNPFLICDTIKKRGVDVTGFMFLSTCNRVEIIYTLQDPEEHDLFLEIILETMPALESGIMPNSYRGRKALRHLLRLASGLESMVLGETEIRAQIKDAYEDARMSGLLDKRLRVLLQYILQESRQIRNEIPMANLPISVATLATKSLIRERSPQNSREERGSVIIIGSGPMSRQAAEYLAKDNEKLILVNRSLSKIEGLAMKLGAQVASFDRFLYEPDTLGPIEAVITATSRPDAFITPEFIKKIKEFHTSPHPLVVVDMALPPDADPACAQIPGVSLISMETLRIELEENRQKRVIAAQIADSYLSDALFRIEANLVADLSSSLVKRIQADVRDKAREKLDNLIEERLAHLSKKDKNIIYNWALQSHKEMNRIHRKGLETVIKNYCISHKNNEILIPSEH
jgi:glutamyl-tRNA reductase